MLDRETSAKATELYRMRTALDAVVDRLALITFAAFVETREEIIKRQGRRCWTWRPRPCRSGATSS